MNGSIRRDESVLDHGISFGNVFSLCAGLAAFLAFLVVAGHPQFGPSRAQATDGLRHAIGAYARPVLPAGETIVFYLVDSQAEAEALEDKQPVGSGPLRILVDPEGGWLEESWRELTQQG